MLPLANKRARAGGECLTAGASQLRHVLASVAYVQRCIPTIGALPHELLTSFLDWSHLWTLESATKAGLVHALDYLRAREFPQLDTRIRQARFANGTRLAIKSTRPCLHVFKWWFERYDPSLTHLVERTAIEDAVKYGHLRLLQWFYGRGDLSAPGVSLGRPIECHHEKIARWVYANNVALSLKLSIDAAASESNLGYARWIQDHEAHFEVECTREAMTCAARSGDLAMAKWLRANRRACCSDSALAAAAERGDLQMVQWLYQNHWDVWFAAPSSAISSAAIVRWVVNHFVWGNSAERLAWIYKATSRAAYRGDFKLTKELYWIFQRDGRGGEAQIRQWLLNDGVVLGFALDAAADGGHLDILTWLWANGSRECSTDAMDFAAINNHLHVLKWLHAHTSVGCTHQAMDGAATRGNFEVLKWLHANRTEGCTTEAMDFAAGNGLLEIVQWLHEHRTEGCTVTAMDTAGEQGHLDMIQWLYANRTEGCSPDAIAEAARRGNLEVVRWLCERFPVQCNASDVADKAAYKGHTHVLAFLISHAQTHCSAQGVEDAAGARQFEVLDWLLQHDGELAHLDAMLRGISTPFTTDDDSDEPGE